MTGRELSLTWKDGGQAWVMQTDGVHGTLRSTRQAAPGTPLSAALSLESGKQVRFKVRECRRLDEDTYLLKGRWVDLPRTMREEMLGAMSDGSGS